MRPAPSAQRVGGGELALLVVVAGAERIAIPLDAVRTVMHYIPEDLAIVTTLVPIEVILQDGEIPDEPPLDGAVLLDVGPYLGAVFIVVDQVLGTRTVGAADVLPLPELIRDSSHCPYLLGLVTVDGEPTVVFDVGAWIGKSQGENGESPG